MEISLTKYNKILEQIFKNSFLQSGNVAHDYIQSTNIIDRKIKIKKNNNEEICNSIVQKIKDDIGCVKRSDNVVLKNLLTFVNFFEPNSEVLNIKRPCLSDNMKQLFDNYYYQDDIVSMDAFYSIVGTLLFSLKYSSIM